MDDEVLFEGGGVRVNRARVQMAGRTYAIHNVTSVRTATQPPDRGGAFASLGCGGLLLMAGLLGVAGSGQGRFGGLLSLLFAAGLIALGVHLFRLARPTHHLFLTTSGTEEQALRSKDRSLIDGVEAAIYRAMDSRS